MLFKRTTVTKSASTQQKLDKKTYNSRVHLYWKRVLGQKPKGIQDEGTSGRNLNFTSPQIPIFSSKTLNFNIIRKFIT